MQINYNINMNELLTAILILLIFGGMYFIISAIMKADKKVVAMNNRVDEVKNTDFKILKKTVNILNKVNKYIQFGKIRRIFEIVMTCFSVVNIYMFYKKLTDKK